MSAPMNKKLVSPFKSQAGTKVIKDEETKTEHIVRGDQFIRTRTKKGRV